MIYRYHDLVKHGLESIEDDPRSELPIEVTTPNLIEKIEKLILEVALLEKKQLSALVEVSDTTFLRIL